MSAATVDILKHFAKNSTAMPEPFLTQYLLPFDPSPFKDKDGRLKVLVVFKKTRLQLYTQKSNEIDLQTLIQDRDSSVENLQDSHDQHQKCLAHVIEVMTRYPVEIQQCSREELTTEKTRGRLVVTIGGDGTVLDASHYVTDSPLLGVNSDPVFSVGALCIATSNNFESFFTDLVNGKLSVCKVARMSLNLDGNLLPVSALNDILIAHENPAAMSRYVINDGNSREEYKSSGVWIGTATGSTGAVASAGGEIQPMSDHRLQVLLREPYSLRWVDESTTISITSHMTQGQIYVDGPHWRIPFGLGSCLEVNSHGHPLRLFVTYDMELRRQNIGFSRRSKNVEGRGSRASL